MPTLSLPPKDLNFSRDVIHIEIEGSNFTGAGPYEPSEENLKGYVQCWMTDPEGNDHFLCELDLPYSLLNKKAFFDYSALLDQAVYPSAPTPGVLFDGLGGGFYSKTASCKFWFKYADQFGVPVEVEATLNNSGDYYAVYGASKYIQGFPSLADYVLHSYRWKDGNIFMKEVRPEQIELIYFYATSAKSVQLNVTRYYTDGTQDYLLNKNSLVSTAYAVNYIVCGFNQIGIGDGIPADKELSYYKISTVGLDNNMDIYYQLDNRKSDYDQYLFYDNGIGGIETLRISGKHIYDYNAEGNETYNRPRTDKTNFQEGTHGIIPGTGYEEVRANTGYYSREYCWHLRQLLLSHAWFIDTDRKKCYKIVITSSKIKTYDLEDDLHYIEFSYKMDEEITANTFNF